MDQIETDDERCVCPQCHVDVAEDATRCPKCGEMFPAMADRRGLTTTSGFHDAIRTVVLMVAIVIAAGAVLAGLVSFVAGRV